MKKISYTKKSVAKFSDEIASAWQKATLSILRVGHLILLAEQSLSKTDFRALKQDLEDRQILSSPTISKLKKVALNTVLNKTDYHHLLPPSYETLYKLTTIKNDELLEQKIINGEINTQTQQKDISVIFSDLIVEPVANADKIIISGDLRNIPQHEYDQLQQILNSISQSSNIKVSGINGHKERKKGLGQFLTNQNIADYMGSLFDKNKNAVHILDAGAGEGILAVTLTQRLIKDGVQSITIDLFEIDNQIIPTLKKNILTLISDNPTIQIVFNISNENFILHEHTTQYDLIIANPPYLKISKQSLESKNMSYVVHGQPNMYMLFMAKSAELLKDSGEMVFITPRSFTSGSSFSKFRNYLLSKISISNIHLYKSKTKPFNGDNVIQELIITKMKKSYVDNTIITSSHCGHTKQLSSLKVPRKYLFGQMHNNIRIPTTKEDLGILKKFDEMDKIFSSLGLKVSTGRVTVPLYREYLSDTKQDNYVPMIWADNIIANSIHHPIITRKEQYIIHSVDSKRLLIKVNNYIVVKRIGSVINLGYIFKDDYEDEFIGLENHLNYICKANGSLTRDELEKLGTFLSSELVGQYLLMVNGNTQINASDIINLPIPENLL